MNIYGYFMRSKNPTKGPDKFYCWDKKIPHNDHIKSLCGSKKIPQNDPVWVISWDFIFPTK